MVRNVAVYLSAVLASFLLVVMRMLWSCAVWLVTWHSTTEEPTSTQSSEEISQLVLTCTVSTREHSDVIEIPQRPGSTHSYTEQVITSLAPYLVKVSKLGPSRVNVSYNLSRRWRDSSLQYKHVSLVAGSFSVLTEENLASAQSTLRLTRFCNQLEQYS